MQYDLSYAYNELFWWQHGDGTNHSALCFNLYAKSDPDNKIRFRLAWPEYAQAFDEWNAAAESDAFFWEKTPHLARQGSLGGSPAINLKARIEEMRFLLKQPRSSDEQNATMDELNSAISELKEKYGED